MMTGTHAVAHTLEILSENTYTQDCSKSPPLTKYTTKQKPTQAKLKCVSSRDQKLHPPTPSVSIAPQCSSGSSTFFVDIYELDNHSQSHLPEQAYTTIYGNKYNIYNITKSITTTSNNTLLECIVNPYGLDYMPMHNIKISESREKSCTQQKPTHNQNNNRTQ